MAAHLGVALVLGALMGLEREVVGKEAGVRTSMMVAGGAAVFAIIGLTLPYLVATSPANLNDVLARNGGFLVVIANIVLGVGFLGAGTIVKSENRVHGLTTAAVVWCAAAVGVLAGIGLLKFAAVTAIALSGALYVLRKIGLRDQIEGK